MNDRGPAPHAEVDMEPTHAGIPLPVPTDISRPHWEGCHRGELLVQRCRDCRKYVFVPELACTRCLSPDLEWTRSEGRGVVHSYTVVWRPQQPAFGVPYVVAVVELEEGWHMLSNVIGCPVDDVTIGMGVEVDFVAMSEQITLPFFRPASFPD